MIQKLAIINQRLVETKYQNLLYYVTTITMIGSNNRQHAISNNGSVNRFDLLRIVNCFRFLIYLCNNAKDIIIVLTHLVDTCA